MSKLKVSELFYSLQGEGRFVGVPSIFLRTFGCNFTCAGFGMPAGCRSTETEFVDPAKYRSFTELPLVHTGCDSYASWDPRFKHLSPMVNVDELVGQMLLLTPNEHWVQDNGNDVHLVITGGEPLLGWQRAYPDLLRNPRMSDLKNITFETNGTQDLHRDFSEYLEEWQHSAYGREVTFSVSAKLSASGELREDAIRPEIVTSYQEIGFTYLKFVVDSQAHFDEAVAAVEDYRKAGFDGPVYVMPVGGTTKLYDTNKFNVAEAALAQGYYYSPRLHVDIWGNSWGK